MIFASPSSGDGSWTLMNIDLSGSIYLFVLYICDQAVKDDVGTIRIQRPHKGPFYVSPKAIDHLIANLGKWARLCLHKRTPSCTFFFFVNYFLSIIKSVWFQVV